MVLGTPLLTNRQDKDQVFAETAIGNLRMPPAENTAGTIDILRKQQYLQHNEKEAKPQLRLKLCHSTFVSEADAANTEILKNQTNPDPEEPSVQLLYLSDPLKNHRSRNSFFLFRNQPYEKHAMS